MVEIKKTKKGQYRVYSKAANSKILQFSEELKTTQSVYKHVMAMMDLYGGNRIQIKFKGKVFWFSGIMTYLGFKNMVGGL